MKIFFLEQVDTASGYYRIVIPNDEIIRQRLATPMTLGAIRKINNFNTERIKKMSGMCLQATDIIVAQMPGKIETEPIFNFANFANIPVLIEVDDLVDKATDWITDVTNNRSGRIWLERVRIWSKADGFITTTKYLADHYSAKFNKPVYIFRKQLDFSDYRWDAVKKLDDGKVVIGYMGSLSHFPDIKTIEPVIYEILSKYPNVEFHFIGCKYTLKEHERIKFFTAKKEHRKIEGQGEFWDLDDYPKLMNFDIGIIPLVGEPFNLAKSDLKFLEYARLKIPSVVQKMSTYKCVQDGINGLLAGSKKEWLRQLCKLIENKPKRIEVGSNAYNYLKDRRQIKQHIGSYIEILQKAIMLKGERRKPSKLTIIKDGRIYA